MKFHPEFFDVIVVGGGHAAIEAALAPARMGLKVAMITLDPQKIGLMSCNPAIGGIAKGQAVREIDALGGEMGRATDRAALQYRLLNRGKGPAVWSPRAQCDRELYRLSMTRIVQAQENLTVHAGECADLVVDSGRVCGIVDQEGLIWRSRAVIVTTGTFLNGTLHYGLDSTPGGRRGDPPVKALAVALRKLGFEMGRLKTGTPMRLDGRSIDYSQCEIQPGDSHPIPFSYKTRRLPEKQLPCWLTYTNEQTHQVIRENLHRTPLYSGKINTKGVRYCPSIEDKIVKFPHHHRHHLFIEPEGFDTDEVYINGLFTSLPPDAQEELIKTIPAFHGARFMHYGYAIEYDFCPPTQLKPTLETKLISGLYFAGQINGTTGYEEAAGQGLLAGVNAALQIREEPPLILGRDEAYLGVMVDDLVTKGVDEPYRLLTSRAEYRIHLRWDNADLRLMDYARRVGLMSEKDYEDFALYRHGVQMALSKKEELGSPMKPFSPKGCHSRESGNPGSEPSFRENGFPIDTPDRNIRGQAFGNDGRNAAGSVDYKIESDDPLRSFKVEEGPWGPANHTYQVWVQHKYAGYLERQEAEILKFRKLEQKRVPEQFDFSKVPGLSLESREKFLKVRPASLGQASRIPGVAPADISILLIYLKRYIDDVSNAAAVDQV